MYYVGYAVRIIATAMTVLILLAGCGKGEPTATSAPATAARIALEATDTLLPPSATPVSPTAAPTAPEPSAMPTEAPPQPTATPRTRPGYFSRDQLIEDTRQLAEILESAHPDPYINGGGRIAFHRRLQRILNSIPEEGMKKEAYIQLLRPFVAALGDSHTRIWDGYAVNSSRPGGVPLQFAIVEKSLYVAGVPRSLPQELLGYLLVSVEGLPVDELVERETRLVGCENEIYALVFLSMNHSGRRPTCRS
jgi:hypothetical protein